MRVANPTTAKRIRPPVGVDRFYPGDPADLRRTVKGLLAEVEVTNDPPPKAIIAPHAGYRYSGPIAASAYARLLPDRHRIHRIILLGPSHYGKFAGLATSSSHAFATPLGLVSLDRAILTALGSLRQTQVLDEAHAPEHCLEVQLPFLQTILDEFTIVPLLTGEATDEHIIEVLEVLWGGPETRIVISSDLSHYHNYATARTTDEATALAIESLQPEQLNADLACGCLPIRGLLQTARRHGFKVRNVDLRNSGDTAGRRDRVVGYGAFVCTDR